MKIKFTQDYQIISLTQKEKNLHFPTTCNNIKNTNQ